MRFLRTAPTRRLFATLAGVVLAAISCTAIAVAATSGGPVPAPKPLATALHDALAAPAPQGISAQVTFTNNLISSNDLVGSDPLFTGATGRLWLTKDHFRLELQSTNGDAQIVAGDGSYWIYDPSSNTVYRGTLPTGAPGSQAGQSGTVGHSGDAGALPGIARIQTVLDRLSRHLNGLSTVPTDVAGQPAYSVRVSPSASGGLLGSVELAWDAAHGVPLSFSVYAKGDSTPVLSLQATSISYGAVDPSVFAISPPSDAQVVELGGVTVGQPQSGEGAPSTAAPLSFTVDAPATAGSLKLTSEQRAGREAELLSYGSGLGSVEVLERPAGAGKQLLGGSSSGASGSGDQGGLSLPTETINGTTATELTTELGTALEFARGGISYLVFGSVPLETANAVAGAL